MWFKFFIVIFCWNFSAHSDVLYEFSEQCMQSGAQSNWDKVSLLDCQNSNLKKTDLKQHPELFCSYQVKTSDTMQLIFSKLGFYRGQGLQINSETGNLRSNQLISGERLFFSKRDLIRQKYCKPVSNLRNGTFVMHIPNSIYALQNSLSFKTTPKTKTQKSPSKKISPSTPFEISPLNPTFDFNVLLFFESLKGVQTSNGTSARLSNSLSPSLQANVKWKFRDWFYYGLIWQTDFHIFEKQTGLFEIENNNLYTTQAGIQFSSPMQGPIQAVGLFSVLEELFYEKASTESIELKKDLMLQVSLGFKWEFFKTSTWTLGAQPLASYAFPEDKIVSKWSIQAPIFANWGKSNYKIGIQLGYRYTKKETSSLELTHNFLHLGLNSQFNF